MSKDVRLSVRVAQTGADAIQKVVDETGSDRSKVTREFLTVALAHAGVYKDVVKRLNQRRGIE